MYRHLSTLLIVLGTGLAYAQTASEPEVWKQFRQAYPFHTQVVALTPADSEGRRAMILSEPPPHVTVDGLKKVLGPAALKVQLLKHPIGVDGWVKDALVDLEAVPESQVNEMVSAVHWYAFGTTYKASALVLPAVPIKERPRVDLSFTMSDLEDHILASQELFSNPETATPMTVAGLLQAKKAGLFYSSKRGAVVWIVPKGSDLSRTGKTIRRFALDSDLILGAAANETNVAIVARERSVPIEYLPPLRAETILLLASAEGTQLEQSYERNYVYAGRTKDDLDWAPILLSPELIDTEYGSLLNITDQLLKSWSESGKVKYARFQYPPPAIKFPFPEGLYKNAHVQEVTYNWNTSGFGYVVKGPALELFAVNRTGALPVSYISGMNSVLRQKEDRAYGFFASTNDPNLARVVQYGALYQIFRRYKITGPKKHVPTIDRPGADLVSSLHSKLYEALRQDWSAKEQRLVAEDPSEAAALHDQFAKFRKFQTALREVQREPEGLKTLAECLADGGFTYNCAVSFPKTSPIPEAMALSANQLFRQVLLTPDDRQQVMDARLAKNERRDTGWIKTPSVVLSSNPGLVGGHNIRANVFEFRTSPALRAGQTRIVEENGRWIVNMSEADRAKASSLVPWLRTVVEDGRGASNVEIESELAKVRAVRQSREAALGLSRAEATAPRSYETRNTALRQSAVGYTQSGKPHDGVLAARAADLSRLGPSLLISRESGNRYLVIEPFQTAQAGLAPPVTEARARDLESVTELLADAYSKGNVGVHLKGLSLQDALAFKKTAEFRIEAQTGKKVEINAFVERDGELTGELTGKTLATLAETRYDFANPKISAPEITEVEEGLERGTRVDYKLEFKSLELTRPSLFMRVRLFFKNGVVRPAQHVIEAALGKALLKIQTMRGRSLTVNNRLAMLTIKAELAKVCPPETDMHIELADMYLMELSRPIQDDARIRAQS